MLTLLGKTLRKAFEHSVSRHGDGKGRFLQVAGGCWESAAGQRMGWDVARNRARDGMKDGTRDVHWMQIADVNCQTGLYDMVNDSQMTS